jgi:ribosomal protein S18 acetylase RimI-like enzyme
MANSARKKACKHSPVRRGVGDDYELDDDAGRVDVDALVSFLTTEAYWGRWRQRSDIARQLASAWRVVALYRGSVDGGGAMVGFARAVSDGVAFGYLADVYVDPAHRGRGLGRALVQEMVEGSGADAFRWLLHTRDAHGLYAELGFGPPGPDAMERPAPPR